MTTMDRTPRPTRAAARVAALALLPLLAGLAAACSSRGSEKPPPGVTGASAADLTAISRIHQEYVAAHNDADAGRLVALWTEDAVLMPMDEPAITGRQSIREHYEEFFDQNPSQITLTPVETRVAGDWAYERIEMKVALPGGEDKGRHADEKYLWILHREADGAWKIARAIYNLDGGIDGVEGAFVERDGYPNRPAAVPVVQAIASPTRSDPAPAAQRRTRDSDRARRRASTSGAPSTRLMIPIPAAVPAPKITR